MWLGQVLKIEGTFLPQTGEDFWPVPPDEFSVCCDCNVLVDEPTLPPVLFVLKLPPVDGDPEAVVDEDRLLVCICCPCGDKAGLEFPPKDICAGPEGALPGCWDK